jgi:hypothetical protein
MGQFNHSSLSLPDVEFCELISEYSMRSPRRRYLAGLWILAACLILFPINNLPLRVGILLAFLGAYGGLVFVFRGRKPVVIGLLALGAAAGLFLICPGRQPEAQSLRNAYLRSLRTYEGTRYIWGGENRLGIDCSGLIRASLIKANFEQGLLTANPRLVRFSLSLWWHDCSAKALSEEYRGLTRRIARASSINLLELNQAQPGDMAVTTSGVHVLACLGGNEWIEADPDLKKVVIIRAPTKDNPWFDEPVNVVRWAELEGK